MSQDLSFEHLELAFFATTRTICSLLWFVNNPALDERILAYLAKYQERYGVVIYAFVIMGNHYHLIACFPMGNKAAFFRDLNSMIAKLTGSKVENYGGGKLWARRVRVQALPNPEDIKDRMFYAALNPVAAGLVQKLSDYTSYNSFSDAIRDTRRKFKVTNWEAYNNRKRHDPTVTIAEYTTTHTLTFSRLPGYEELSRREYVDVMNKELETRRQEVVENRIKSGKGFATREALRKLIPGTKPKTTKTSTRTSHRPLVLTRCKETRKQFLDWYFSLLNAYKEISRRFRNGETSIEFPPGTYRPWSYCALAQT